MLKKDLIIRNPLQAIGRDSQDILKDGQFGAVLARAGVGKTAFLVQLALNGLLRELNVLHISLDDPVRKVVLWYEEVLRRIAQEYHTDSVDALLEGVLPHRFIMTFRAEGFSVPKLKERLTDLTAQGVFRPRMVLIDGLEFDARVRDCLNPLKTLAEQQGFHVWFAVRTHRHIEPDVDGMPAPLVGVADLFDVVLELQPKAEQIRIKALKGTTGNDKDRTDLSLDPATMLIRSDSETHWVTRS
ncbi:MAG: cytoplasmic protein [Deltaproteobacteria bacterium]|nr:cytoplasmic protein [Deltaproteobacteria bacterium]